MERLRRIITAGAIVWLVVGVPVGLLMQQQAGTIAGAVLRGASEAKVDKFAIRIEKVAFAATLVSIVGPLVLIWATRRTFFERFVKPATPGTLGAIRMLACAVLLTNTLWEDLPSIAHLPPEMRNPMGFMRVFYKLPIHFDDFVASETALRIFKSFTALFLLMGAIGLKTRWVVPLGAFCWFIQGGIIRQYAWFTHQGIVALNTLIVLSFTRCGDGFSLDRLIREWRGQPVPPRDLEQPTYGWARYACWVVFAMCYVSAGLSKAHSGGWTWFNAQNMRHIVANDALMPMHFESRLGLLVFDFPDFFFILLGLGAMYGEMAGVFVLFSYWFRQFYAIYVFMLHMGIWLLQNVLFFDMIFMQLILIDFRTLRKKIGQWMNARRGRWQVLFDPNSPQQARIVRVLQGFDLLERVQWLPQRTEKIRVLSPSPGTPGEGRGEGVHPSSFIIHPYSPRLRHPLIIAALLIGMFSIWALHIEFYPLTSVQMYSRNRTDGIIRYWKVLARDESGKLQRAYPERAIGAMKDSRYRRVLDMFPLPEKRETARRFFVTCGQKLNEQTSPGSRITQFEIERWNWEFVKDPDDPDRGELYARYIVTSDGQLSVQKNEALRQPPPRLTKNLQ